MIDFDPKSFDWAAGLANWGIVCGGVLAFAIILALLYQLLIHLVGRVKGGIPKAFGAFGRSVSEGFRELVFMSPRRVGAMAMLVARESWRRKTLGVFVVFGIFFLFAGWFLSNPDSDRQLKVQIYVTFVLTAISWLILPAVFLMSCWGLPDDIKARSLHTVVTKPIRRSEVLVGRILGVTLVGTLVVIAMSVVGYLWLLRALPETQGMKTRVPVFGKISFLDREGKPVDKGINVGDINEFRSYIEGDTQARAIWTFSGVTPRLLNKDGKLLLESKIQAFRTHKGNIERSVIFQFTFVNPTRKIRAKYEPFEVNEFRDSIKPIDTDLVDDKNNPVKLMADLVDNEKLTVEVACLSSGQYLGMARPDLFIRAADATFTESYFKAVFSTWLMMFLIVVFAVSVSTIVKGPVAAFLTGIVIVLGMFSRDFMKYIITTGTQYDYKGGGLIESIYRILNHTNPNVDLEGGTWVTVVKIIDWPLLQLAGRSREVIPDFQSYQMAKFVAHGYDVPWSSGLLPAIMQTIAFVIPCIVLGYFCLKSRELESK